MVEIGHKDLSGHVIEAAIAVHVSLGPGFVESIYEKALCVELASRGIKFEQQKVVRIQHRGVDVGEHRLDLLVEGSMLVELKAAGIRDGLILNFASMPLSIKRIGPGLARS